MSISNIVEKFYSETLKKIKNCKGNIIKRIHVRELLNNLINSGIKISIRKLAKTLQVSRVLLANVYHSLLGNEILNNNLKIEKRGRIKCINNSPELVLDIKKICEKHEHVDKSLKDHIVYLDITLRKIKETLKEQYGYNDNCPRENTIKRILIEELKYKITRIKKDKVYKKIPETNKIFDNVNTKLEYVKNSGNNVIAMSIDDKTTKYIGNLSDNGFSWIEKHALDHDTKFDYAIKPFGILDLKENTVNVYCTSSHSTAIFKVNSIDQYISEKISKNSNINELYIFLDNGPENSSRTKLWKKMIINLSIKYNIKIELVYYPPYHSKYNKIEHFWGVLQRHWNRLIIDSLDKLIGAINSCTWDNKYAKAYMDYNTYEKGIKVDEEQLEKLEKEHVTYPDLQIKKWSLIITPQTH